MEEKRLFETILWEETDDYKQAKEDAEIRFREIYSKLRERGFVSTYTGSLRFGEDGFEVWINDNRNIYRRIPYSKEEAINTA